MTPLFAAVRKYGRRAALAAWPAALAIGLLIMAQPVSAEGPGEESAPQAMQYPRSAYPSEVPPVAETSCRINLPCWAIVWGDHTYWVLESTHNSQAFIIAAYDDQGRLLAYKRYPGVRYVADVAVDEEKKTIRVTGQGGTKEFPWTDFGRLAAIELSFSPNPAEAGQTVTVTAKVTGLSPTITGQVNFHLHRWPIMGGDQLLNEAPLELDENGEASLAVTLPPGRHEISAEYLGSPDAAAGQSREMYLYVNMEKGAGPYVEYRLPDDGTPLSRPPGMDPRCSAGSSNLPVCPVVVWGDFEYRFFGYLETIVVAAYENGILKGFTHTGTEELEYTDGQYRFKSAVSLWDVSIDGPGGSVVLRGNQGNSDNVIILPSELVALRNMMVSSATTLTVSSNAIMEGRKVKLQAEVESGGNIMPTGVVKFFSGHDEVGSAALQDGKATLIVSALPAGTHDLVARYLGDAVHENSDSAPVRLVVQEKALDGEPEIAYIPQREAPHLDADGLRMYCSYRLDGDDTVYCPVVRWADYSFWLYADNERARMFWVALNAEGQPVGYRNASRYLDLEDMAIDAASRTLTVTGTIALQPHSVDFGWGDLVDVLYSVRVVLTLNEASELRFFGDTISLTAKVTKPEGTLAGKLVLKNGDGQLTAAQDVSADGTASFELSLFREGKLPIKAHYHDDLVYDDSDSNIVSVMVQYSEDDGSLLREYFPIVIYKHPNERPAQLPGGSPRCFRSPEGFDGYCPVILYKDYSYWILDPGQNAFAMLVAAFDGDGRIAGSQRFEGARYVYDATVDIFNETVLLKGQSDLTIAMAWSDLMEMITATYTELDVSPTTAAEGTPVALSAKVTGYRGEPAGTVTFKNGDDVIATVPVDMGRAKFTVTDFPAGKHVLRAYYNGDGIQDPSESGPVELTVKPDVPPEAESVILRSSNPGTGWAKAGDTVTLEFAVSDEIRHVAVTIAGRTVTAEQADEEGLAWRASRVLDEEDPEGDVAFTLDFENAFGRAADRIVSTTDGSRVVFDKTKPVLTLLGNPAVVHDVLEAYADLGATASDNFADDAVMTGRITVSGEVDADRLGIYVLTYHVKDFAGNAAETVARTVYVQDRTPPVIVLLGDGTVTLEQGQAYVEAGVEAHDNYDGDLTAFVSVSGDVDTGRPGTYKLTYTVTDSSGNQARRERIILVVPAADPGGGSGGDGEGSDEGGDGEGPGDDGGGNGNGNGNGRGSRGSGNGNGNAGNDAVRDGDGTDQTSSDSAGQAVTIFINGRPEDAGIMTMTDADGRPAVVIALDENVLEQRLHDEGEQAVIAIQAPMDGAAVIGELTGRMVKIMEMQQSIVEVRTGRASYRIPASHFGIDELAERFGPGIPLQDIKVQIEIDLHQEEDIRFAENADIGHGIVMIVPPVSFQHQSGPRRQNGGHRGIPNVCGAPDRIAGSCGSGPDHDRRLHRTGWHDPSCADPDCRDRRKKVRAHQQPDQQHVFRHLARGRLP